MKLLNLHGNPWNNKYSSCLRNGHILNFLKSIDIDKTMAIPQSDGCIHTSDSSNLHEFQGFEDHIIIGALCSIGTIPISNKVVYLPLDDDIFEYGLKNVLQKDLNGKIPPLWEDRYPIAFWRGAVNASMVLRKQLIEQTYNDPNFNVKFIITPWSSSQDWNLCEWNENVLKYYDRYVTIPSESSWEVIARPYSIYDHMCYKYLIIIDGFIIASNLQWIFGSGSVPILVTCKDNKYWFKEYLIPYSFENNNIKDAMCIEINDISNVNNVVRWLKDNDEIAKNISENSLKFSQKVFSSDFQKYHLKTIFLNK